MKALEKMGIENFLSKTKFLLCLCTVSIASCQGNAEVEKPSRPNILWLVAEDLGPYIAPFGDSTTSTPNLSRLASEGVIYTRTFSPSGVCAPSRAAIATGMYPSSIGASHMRTRSNSEATGVAPYEAIPPPEVRMVSEILRINGYYCTNNAKEDYQFDAPVTAWDESGRYAHWRNRPKDQPFFAVFNFNQTHESGLFEPYGFKNSEKRHYHSGDRDYEIQSGQTAEEETPNHVSKDADFPIPPYLPDTETVRRDLWKMYNNIAEMDLQIGAVLKQLEDDGLLENTIVFFYGDHGGPLPRQKRLIYDSGLNTPLVIRLPGEKNPGQKDPQLISFVDFAPTLLSLAGIKPPEYMQGQSFLGEHRAKQERTYIHGAADRFDEVTDAIRVVRDNRFKYIRNYRPQQGYYLPLAYRERIPTMLELLKLRDEGELDSIQQLWFREKKDPEELFDCNNDPYELKNLAGDPAYADHLEELREEMDRWIEEIGDQPNLPEKELLDQLWSENVSKPITSTPQVISSKGKIKITCDTDGASIGYKIIHQDETPPKAWTVYLAPIELEQDSKLLVMAHRIGFEPSKMLEIDLAGIN